jgi:prephenate dehydrogenase
MRKIGIIGVGDFGKFLEKHLQKYFEVEIFDRKILADISLNDSIQTDRINNVDFLVFSITLNGLEDVCQKIQGKIKKEVVLVDVMSIKVKPIEIMKRYFPDNQILATHPIFGPQSGKNGLKDLPIVLTNVSLSEDLYTGIKSFLLNNLELKVIERTLEQHDKEMAYIQGLSHFIGRALETMDIQDYESKTYSYAQLLKLRELLGKDSFELFKTIQNGNPHAKEIRENFLKVLIDLEKTLGDNRD